jgi:hypothetical protein
MSKHRIELHRDEFIKAKGQGPLIALDSIDATGQMILAHAFHEWIAQYKGEGEVYERYLRFLSSWGIMCPHPQERRSYPSHGSSVLPKQDDEWYTCGVCKCVVINEHCTQKKERSLVADLKSLRKLGSNGGGGGKGNGTPRSVA